jgi:hypothetical protein
VLARHNPATKPPVDAVRRLDELGGRYQAFAWRRRGRERGGGVVKVWSVTIRAPRGTRGLCLSALVLASAVEARTPPHSIASITVCSPTASGPSVSCPVGTGDTALPVLAPTGYAINGPLADPVGGAYGGLATLADEHSTVFPPGTLPGHPDYLVFAASRTTLNPTASGMVVLTGGSGPSPGGQWTLDFAPDFGRYVPANPAGSRNGQLLLSPLDHSACQGVGAGNFDRQDPTFDLNYADPGTVLVDPTSCADRGTGSLLAVYEGTNRCIGRTGASNKGNNFYSSIAIATSNDHGHTWPTYRANPPFDFYPLPAQNPGYGPAAPWGASGADVCVGNDCATAPPSGYGRYAVLAPVVTVAQAMGDPATQQQEGLASNVGDSEPSAFVDVPSAGPDRYLYVVHNYAPGPFAENPPLQANTQSLSDLAVARARLDGGAAPLEFSKWYGQSFSEPGLPRDGGGAESPIFPKLASDLPHYRRCLAPDQSRAMGSLSYVVETRQYLLTFVCSSPTDPRTGASYPGDSAGQSGAAWFYSTIDARRFDLSHQEQWSAPQEIVGSWSPFSGGGCFRNFDGWYPTFMSPNRQPGQLSTSGYVFYMRGCTDDQTPGGRQFSTRAFVINTTD